MENPTFLMDDLGVPLFQEPLFGEVSLRPQSVSHPWKREFTTGGQCRTSALGAMWRAKVDTFSRPGLVAMYKTIMDDNDSSSSNDHT